MQKLKAYKLCGLALDFFAYHFHFLFSLFYLRGIMVWEDHVICLSPSKSIIKKNELWSVLGYFDTFLSIECSKSKLVGKFWYIGEDFSANKFKHAIETGICIYSPNYCDSFFFFKIEIT